MITDQCILQFEKMLAEQEKACGTIKKYLHDLQKFREFLDRNRISKEQTMQYKEKLMQEYCIATVNTKLVSLNRFLKFSGKESCMVKTCKVQRSAFRGNGLELSGSEYKKLVRTASAGKKERLSLILETLAATGIRISELKYITVESVQSGNVDVTAKGKSRQVLLPLSLSRKLDKYSREKGIKKGCIFITRKGNPVDRCNIFHEMKKLADLAGISRRKVFPHNLRHLFAVTFFRLQKDLPRLADLLGHSSINTTRIYTQISKKEYCAQMEKLGLVL